MIASLTHLRIRWPGYAEHAVADRLW